MTNREEINSLVFREKEIFYKKRGRIVQGTLISEIRNKTRLKEMKVYYDYITRRKARRYPIILQKDNRGFDVICYEDIVKIVFDDLDVYIKHHLPDASHGEYDYDEETCRSSITLARKTKEKMLWALCHEYAHYRSLRTQFDAVKIQDVGNIHEENAAEMFAALAYEHLAIEFQLSLNPLREFHRRISDTGYSSMVFELAKFKEEISLELKYFYQDITYLGILLGLLSK